MSDTPVSECPNCGKPSQGERRDCAHCGIVFAKWGKVSRRPLISRLPAHRPLDLYDVFRQARSLLRELAERATYVHPEPAEPARLVVLGRGLLLIILVVMTWSWARQSLDGASRVAPSFAHYVLSMANLVFHEAGHVFFGFFGRFLTSLGGSLFQILLPLLWVVLF